MSIDADLAAAIALAETEASARIAAAVGAAGIAAAATEQSAVTQAQADEQVAVTSANAQKIIATTNADADKAVASTMAAAQEVVATTAANADINVANIEADAQKTVAVTNANADTTVATTSADAQKAVAVTGANADTTVAGTMADAQKAVANTNLTGVEYSSDKQLTGVEYVADAETQRLELTLAFAQDKWNQVFPLVQQLIQNPNTGSGAISWSGLIAAIGAAPLITQGGIYTPSQVQAQLNTLYARADNKSQTLLHDAQIDLAGRGFGGASPLLDMLRFSYEAENIETSTEGALQLAVQLAKDGSELLLEQQKLQQQQYASNEQFFAELDKIAVDLATGMFSSVAQIISALGG